MLATIGGLLRSPRPPAGPLSYIRPKGCYEEARGSPGGHTSFKEQRKGSRARQVASSKITDSKIAEDEDEGRVFLEE